MNGGEKVKQLREEINKLVAERDYAIRWASKTVEDVTADKDALIRELVAALAYVAAGAVVHERQYDYKPCVVASAALAKAKAAGYEP
jgi:hypothetical protein